MHFAKNLEGRKSVNFGELLFFEGRTLAPLLGFMKEIFQFLELPPSELHHNSFSFIRTFALVREDLMLTPTIASFFSIFVLQ